MAEFVYKPFSSFFYNSLIKLGNILLILLEIGFFIGLLFLIQVIIQVIGFNFLIILLCILAYIFSFLGILQLIHILSSVLRKNHLIIHPEFWLSSLSHQATIVPSFFSLSNGRDFFIDQNHFSFISIRSRRNEVLKFFVLIALSCSFFLFGITLADLEINSHLLYTTLVIETIIVIIPFFLIFAYANVLIRDDITWTFEKTSNNSISFSIFNVFDQTDSSNVFTSQFNSFSVTSSPYKSLFPHSLRKYFHRNKNDSILTVSLSNNSDSTNTFSQPIILFIDSSMHNVELIRSVWDKWLKIPFLE